MIDWHRKHLRENEATLRERVATLCGEPTLDQVRLVLEAVEWVRASREVLRQVEETALRAAQTDGRKAA